MLEPTRHPEESTHPVSSQPTRFENYPPEHDGGVQRDFPDDPVPDPAPVVRAYIPPPLAPPSNGSTRRGVIGAMIAIPVFGLIALGSQANDAPDPGGYDPGAWYPEDEPDESPEVTPEQLTVGGRYDVTVPSGWEYTPDGGGGVEFTNGDNRLAASGIDVPPSTLATDELPVLARSHHKGFTGRLGKPVDDSTADVQHARLTGKGKFRGKPATLRAELWIDDTGSGLLTTRILTVKPSSEVGVAAQGMVDGLSKGF